MALACRPRRGCRRRLRRHTCRSLADAEAARDRSALERAFFEAVKGHGGGDSLTREAFVEVCRTALLLDLTPTELARIFDNIVLHEGSRGLSCDTFVQTVRQRFFLRGVRRVLCLQKPTKVQLASGYDLDRETYENHSGPAHEGLFYGPYAAIRATRDHAYHGHYSRARQLWQDSVLETVVQRTAEQALPRLVFTCGAMGVGKGYALGWMSTEGIFPLENIVHIDPDHFKQVMPEWPAYVEHGRRLGDPEIPGNLCHRESCYLLEIALEESLRRSQNIWVDGSLRNAEWFVKVFDDIRERFPAYRIAIFQVTAPEAVVRRRVAERARRTGRAIPEKLLQASIEAVDRSVLTLTPRADFLVSIDNGEAIPKLRYFASLDRSGDWSALAGLFGRTLPAPVEFPLALAPIFLEPVRGCELELDGPLRSVSEGQLEGQAGHLIVRGERYRVLASPAFGVTLYGESRRVAKVPDDAAMVAWLLPPDLRGEVEQEGLGHAQRSLLRFGGPAFFGLDEALVGINATAPEPQGEPPAMLQFGPPEEVRREEAATLAPTRWAEVTLPHLRDGGARRLAFVTPQEKLGGRRVSAGSGLVFEVEGGDEGGARYVFFQIRRALA